MKANKVAALTRASYSLLDNGSCNPEMLIPLVRSQFNPNDDAVPSGDIPLKVT